MHCKLQNSIWILIYKLIFGKLGKKHFCVFHMYLKVMHFCGYNGFAICLSVLGSPPPPPRDRIAFRVNTQGHHRSQFQTSSLLHLPTKELSPEVTTGKHTQPQFSWNWGKGSR